MAALPTSRRWVVPASSPLPFLFLKRNDSFADCLVVHPQEMDRQAEWSMAAEEAKESVDVKKAQAQGRLQEERLRHTLKNGQHVFDMEAPRQEAPFVVPEAQPADYSVLHQAAPSTQVRAPVAL